MLFDTNTLGQIAKSVWDNDNDDDDNEHVLQIFKYNYCKILSEVRQSLCAYKIAKILHEI